ncbi:MAG: PucR family transcriptional regulator [Solirubrobacterales bacterium]
MAISDRTAPPIEELIEQFAPVAAELEQRREELIDRITTAIREEIPNYGTIPYRGLRDAVSVHVRRGLEASRGDATASPADLEEAMVIGREAAHFGIPVEGLLQGMRVGVRIFWTECVEAATAHGLDPRTLIAAAELIWNWADAVGLAFVRGHREAAVEEAVHLERERSTFLVGLLQGSLTGPELRSGAEANGLALDREYLPLRARAFGAARPPAHCERTIRRALGPTAEGVTLCPFDEDLIGLVPSRPEIDDPEVVIGLGPPAPAERISPSYGEALRALEAASRFGLRGSFDLADLSLRAPVATETALGERLVARYLAPFRDGSHAGAELERTLRAYLEQGLRGESAARALNVHVNTLRNRLRRIERLIGVSFRDTAQLAELWWALEYDCVAGQGEPDSQPRRGDRAGAQ